jgi:hypothetical protein
MNQDPIPTSVEDDELLKRAIRSAWGGDVAPSALRQRVQMAMTRTVLEEPEIPEATRTRRFWDRWPAPMRVAVGVAALVLVAIGSAWGILEYQSASPRQAAYQFDHLTPAASPTLYAMLVARHDDFAGGEVADEDAPAAAGRIPAIRDALAKHLGHGVWVPDLVKLGWRFDGVRVYPVNGVEAVAAQFSRGGDRISAFSLPVRNADGCAGAPPVDADQVVDGRSVAAFSQEGLLFALVGSRGAGPIPQRELRGVAERFRNDPSCHSGCEAATRPME